MGHFSRRIIGRVVRNIASNHKFDLQRDSPIIFHETIYACSISDSAYFEDFETITELMDPEEWSTSTLEITKEIIDIWKRETKDILLHHMSVNPSTTYITLSNGSIQIQNITTGTIHEG